MTEHDILVRTGRIENRLDRIEAALGSLVNVVDRQSVTTDQRLSAIEQQIAALNESNRLLAELIKSLATNNQEQQS